MAKLLTLSLDAKSVAASFFEDCVLLGVQSKLDAIAFCWELNTKLGLNFKRNLFNDIEIYFKAGKETGFGVPGTLFAEIPTETLVNFALFIHEIKEAGSSLIIYDNSHPEFQLLPEHKQFQYLILIQDESFSIQQKPLLDWLCQIDCVTKVQEIAMDEIDKHRENLII